MSDELLSTTIDKGVLPAGWTWSTLGEQSEKPQYGWTTKANADKGQLKLLRTTDITSGYIDWSSVPYCTNEPDDVEKYMVKSGDVLISRAGSVGVSFLMNKPERAVFASYLIRFRPKKSIDTKYFYYYLKSPGYWESIGASKSGIAVPNVNASKLAQVSIPVAPQDQQKLIVAEIEKQFSRLDEAVANLKRVKANLKRYKAAVLKAAVEGKLVETEAELARREDRSYETGAQLLQSILETRSSQWKGKGKDKEPATADKIDLKELPEGWVRATVSQLLVEPIVNGLSIKESAFSTEVRALRLSAMSEKGFDYSDHRFLPTKLDHVADIIVREGDVFVSRGNGSLHLVGRSTVAQPPPFDVIFPDTMMRLRLAEPVRVIAWFQTIWTDATVRRQIERRVKTTAGIYKIAQPELASITIPLPPFAEQQRIVSEVDRSLSLVREVETQVNVNLKRAERLRQATLAMAFSGKLA